MKAWRLDKNGVRHLEEVTDENRHELIIDKKAFRDKTDNCHIVKQPPSILGEPVNDNFPNDEFERGIKVSLSWENAEGFNNISKIFNKFIDKI